MTPASIIQTLAMQPHPEGGHYVETFRAESSVGDRATLTAIYFLLQRGERSRWHRVDADEIWLWHAGAPLELGIKRPGETASSAILGPNIAAGERPQIVVPAHAWQEAKSLGDWTLVSCVVAPGFEFSGFELLSEGETPPA